MEYTQNNVVLRTFAQLLLDSVAVKRRSREASPDRVEYNANSGIYHRVEQIGRGGARNAQHSNTVFREIIIMLHNSLSERTRLLDVDNGLNHRKRNGVNSMFQRFFDSVIVYYGTPSNYGTPSTHVYPSPPSASLQTPTQCQTDLLKLNVVSATDGWWLILSFVTQGYKD